MIDHAGEPVSQSPDPEVGPASPSGGPGPRAAGIVTRLLAAAIDLVAVLVMMGGLYAGWVGLQFLWSPLSFSWPAPPSWMSVLTGALLAVAYLTAAWATSGRSYGAAVLGLRVLSAGQAPLGWTRSALRAVTCIAFPIGLLWAGISRQRRSVQDALVRSVVVYDWHHGLPVAPPSGATAPVVPPDG